MNTFYLRLLLAFLVANFIVLGVSVVGTQLFLNEPSGTTTGFDPAPIQTRLRKALAKDGVPGVETIAQRESRRGLKLHTLLDGRPSGRAFDGPLRDFVARLDTSTLSRVDLPPPNEVLWSLPVGNTTDGTAVVVIAHQFDSNRRRGDRRRGDAFDTPGGRPPRDRTLKTSPVANSFFSKPNAQTFALYLGLLIVGIAVAGWIVARSLTAPLRSVQTTINRFAHGDLSARVGEHLTARGDDMGRLAGDFDRMANGVEKMIHSRDRLLHQLSHEMRSPLARLRFAIELARGNEEGDETYLSKADREIDRLNALMDEMLHLARTERLPNERTAQTLSLDTMLTEAIERAALAAQESEVRIRRGGETGIRFLGQGDLLKRAFDNVLSNAVKFSPKGGHITITTRVSDGDIEIDVADQGPGVPRSELGDLFEPFYRASNTSEEGYGLGLAIVASALRAHNGQARAALGPHGGLIVTLQIPMTNGMAMT